MVNKRQIQSTVDKFNRNTIRRTIVPLTYDEARRIQNPIYEVLEKELYEAGCPYSARQLALLARREDDLYESRTIGSLICEDQSLLYTLVENAKIAEIAFSKADCDGYYLGMQLLSENLLMLEPLREKYDWVLRRLYATMFQITKTIQGKYDRSDEVIARIYYKYALYLCAKVSDWGQAHNVLLKTLPLVRGKLWVMPPDGTNERTTLHEAVCRQFSLLLRNLSSFQMNKDTKLSIKLAHNAVLVIAEIGIENNRTLMCQSYLKYGQALYENGDFAEAMKALDNITIYGVQNPCCKDEREIYAKLQCEKNICLAGCYLNLDLNYKGFPILFQSLLTAREYEFIRCEADTQLLLGKLYSTNIVENGAKAKQAYEEAKMLFEKIDDLNNTKKATYLLAKLKADEIFEDFLDLIRISDENHCAKYRLYMWKNRFQPFWIQTEADLVNNRYKNDELRCLLNETIGEQLTKSDEEFIKKKQSRPI